MPERSIPRLDQCGSHEDGVGIFGVDLGKNLVLVLSIRIWRDWQCDAVVFPNDVLLAPVVRFFQTVPQLRMWWHSEQTLGGDVLLDQHEACSLPQKAGKARLAIAACGEGGAGAERSTTSGVLDVYVVGYAAVGEICRRGDKEVFDLYAAGEFCQARGCSS